MADHIVASVLFTIACVVRKAVSDGSWIGFILICIWCNGGRIQNMVFCEEETTPGIGGTHICNWSTAYPGR